MLQKLVTKIRKVRKWVQDTVSPNTSSRQAFTHRRKFRVEMLEDRVVPTIGFIPMFNGESVVTGQGNGYLTHRSISSLQTRAAFGIRPTKHPLSPTSKRFSAAIISMEPNNTRSMEGMGCPLVIISVFTPPIRMVASPRITLNTSCRVTLIRHRGGQQPL